MPDEAIGCGFHEAVRGVLSHHLVIRDGKITNYHPYPPTPWNGYPFLGERETDHEAVVDDVRRSILMKAEEIGELRAQTLTESRETLRAAAETVRGAGRVLALGNGGSATDATDLVGDLQRAGRPAIDLGGDPAILTAIANDVGVGAIFARQVIAYGRPGDAVVALSTSGGSANVIAAEGLADHVIVSRSQHIPRIQEAQASAYQVLCELVR